MKEICHKIIVSKVDLAIWWS